MNHDGEIFVAIDISEGEDLTCRMTGFLFWGDFYIWDVEYIEPSK